jgi:outer membrane lipoprotein-sorting protein
MEAIAFLETVAQTYANLKSLSVEMRSIIESGDETSSSRGEHRTKAWFEAPDKVRIESSGRNGMVLTTDGMDLHSFFTLPKRYSKSPAFSRKFVPGLFRPDHASLGATPPPFLFSRIADKVTSADISAGEPGSVLIAVTYEQMPHALLWLSSPVQYWIDSKTQMVSRMEGETSMRMPAQDHTTKSKHAISFVNAIIDEPIAAEVFRFTPPADAVDASDPRGGCGISIGGGGGGSFQGPGGEGRFEHRHSHEWVGDTLIERYKLRMHGIDLTFERRLTFSEDRRELKVSERIIGPNGEATHDLSLPLV